MSPADVATHTEDQVGPADPHAALMAHLNKRRDLVLGFLDEIERKVAHTRAQMHRTAPVGEVPLRFLGDARHVREVCGISTRHTLLAWRQRPGFPKPLSTIRCDTELWDMREINDWLDRRDQE